MYTFTYISTFYRLEPTYNTKNTHTDTHTSTLECTLKRMATERREHERKWWYRCHHTEERRKEQKKESMGV